MVTLPLTLDEVFVQKLAVYLAMNYIFNNNAQYVLKSYQLPFESQLHEAIFYMPKMWETL